MNDFRCDCEGHYISNIAAAIAVAEANVVRHEILSRIDRFVKDRKIQIISYGILRSY